MAALYDSKIKLHLQAISIAGQGHENREQG